MRQVPRCALLLVLLSAIAGCHSSSNLEIPKTQENFGVQMARSNLWREAMFRFRRAVELNPNDAQAHNNLAVAYEANGDYENAQKEYREALRLDRSNQYIQKNYSRFVEFRSRNNKRQKQTATASKDSTTAVTPAATTTAPAAASQASSQPAEPAAMPAATTTAAPAPAPATSTQPPDSTTAPAPAPAPATSTAPPPAPVPPSPKPPNGGSR